ncbi:hemagglutinin repeat-containing protein [Achromobacter mucicolens]|uniref:Hemagglutinin repeat-containing protein n=1 Tax=Achromobacter mucicolens TaxID=1389922 RepID=A0ABD4YZC0_9BURK|nr:hemagglutinin repeat-containing protein [Achromobacter mucicolens]MDH1179669.1 hemagglutinin repeat-containing protein [Achromobacter mucicolens]
MGPDGNIALEVAGGKLRVEGQGLNGTAASQVDLIARTLEINAGVWADRLNVTAGAARVDYATGNATAGPGEGSAPVVALDTAALGGMYANSIRLNGTEAGVGVNVGGNLVALTGNLEVSASGDVRIAPSAAVQAARDLRLASGRDVSVDGAAQAAGNVALAAGGNAAISGAVGAGGSIDVNAAGNVSIAAQAAVQTQGALRVAAGQDLSLGGSLLMGGQDVRVESARNVRIGGDIAPGGTPPGGGAGTGNAGSGGSSSGSGSGSGSAAGGSNAGNGGAAGTATGAAQVGTNSSGLVTAAGAVALKAGRDMVLPGQVTAAGALHAQAGGDLTTGETAQIQSGGPAQIRASADLNLGGLVGARGDLSLMAGRDARVTGKGSATGRIDIDAARDLRMDAPAQWDAEGEIAAKAGAGMALAGTLRANGNTALTAGQTLAVDGTITAASGSMTVLTDGDVALGANAQLAAAGPVGLTAGGSLQSLGKVTSLKDLSMQAARDVTLDGATLATGDLQVQAGETLATSSASRQQADGSVMAMAGDASLAGALIAGQSAQITTQGSLQVDGTLLADAGTLQAASGGDMTLGSASTLQAAQQLTAQAGGNLLANGAVSGEADIHLSADSRAELNGKTVANGTLRAEAGTDLTVGQGGLAQGNANLFLGAGQDLRVAGTAGTAESAGQAGLLQAQAARDLFVTGLVTAGTPASLRAQRNLGVDGTVAALAGNLTADAGGQLRVGANGRMQAAQNLIAQSGADLASDGVIVAGGGLTLAATGDARLGGTAAALGEAGAGNLLVTGRDVIAKQGAQLQAAGTLTAQAQRDVSAAGALASVGDMMLSAARDARVDGTAASDANLTLTGRNVAVGAAGLAQAAGTLTSTAQGTLLAAGSMLAGITQTLSAGSGMTLNGTVAALEGDLKLETQHGNLDTGSASSLQAGAALTATAGGALNLMGSAAAGQAMTLRAGGDATLGGVAATQAGNVTIDALGALSTTADGRIQSAADIDLQSGGLLKNAGIVSAAGAAYLVSDTGLNNTGSVLAGGDVTATAKDALNNSGRFIAGVGDDGTLSLPGSVNLTAAFITHPGISAAGKDMTLAAGGMDLSGGNVSAVGKLGLTTPADITTRNAVLHGGSIDIAAANLRNQGGKITSAGDAVVKLSGELDNTAGLIAAANDARIDAARIGNAGGTLAGANLTLVATGAVDNQGGLIQADDTLTLNAASLDNRATLTAAGIPPKGVLAKTATIVAGGINNQSGAISAGQDLTLDTSELDNTGGNIAAERYATVKAAMLKNHQGKVLAGERLAVTIQALQGLGLLQSAQDLSFTYAGSLNQTGDIAAGRDLTMSVGGNMDNSATVSAGRDLTITANALNNQASGELLAGRNNTINVTNGLTNWGLIDGGATNINAGRLDNFGRIYGNTIAIRAGELVNGSGPGGGAVIASRGDLDIGVGSLVNREHGLIYAAGDMRIGSALDANRKAIGQAASLVNASATIEAAGNAVISAVSLQNINTNYVSEVVPVQKAPKIYVTPAGTTDMYDMETHWLCDKVTALCGKTPDWLDDDPERRFLLPSTRYPYERYGPPFDYTRGGRGQSGVNTPISLAYKPAVYACNGGDAGECYDIPEDFLYSLDARVWSVFGVTPPPPLPNWTEPSSPCFGNQPRCAQEAAQRLAYENAYAVYKAAYLELDQRIREFNADFRTRLVGTFTYYVVEETITETRTVSSDPGKILSGGSMTLVGTVTNDKSQIAAGGTLSVSGPAINNIGAGGQRVITRVGTATVTQPRDSDRKEYSEAYNRTLAAESIELPVGTSGGNVSVSLSGAAPGVSGATATGPVLVASLGLPGGNVVRTVSNPATIPNSQLFAVNGTPDAPYVVATDPRFIGNRESVSSDYLFGLLQQPGAPVGNAGASGAIKTGLGNTPGGLNALIPAGAKFLTPSGQPRRLGDGFYEQKLVSDQILATTGQRFLDGFGENDSQYKQLLANGAQFALNNGIKLGAALTEAQQRQLTTDLVWLVEQTITLPDGTTETVLVPQVYLLVREGDLKGDGTLMAGRDVKLTAGGDINNSGTIGARDATVMTAANIVNQAGGRIQGAIVDLAAREDLVNLVSLIKGDNVALSAGRDIALTSTSASENNGATWGSYVSGVSRVDAGNLSMQAGRDINLTASQVTATEDARLQAGRDINLATLQESHGESLVRNKKNRHELSTSSEVGSSIAADGNLTLIAGQDVNARAADVTAGEQLAVGAGRDINLMAGVQTGSAYDETHYKTKGFMSSKTTHTKTASEFELAQASNFMGDTVALMAGRDLSVQGSNVVGDNDVLLAANRDITIAAATESYKDYQYEKVTKSGLGGGGGFNIGYSKQARTDWMKGESGGFSASTVGSVGGNVTIDAGRDVGVFASNVLAQDGDISIAGRNVAIVAGVGEARQHEYHEFKQSGITIGVAGGMLGAAQQIHGTLQQAGEAKSGRLAAVKVGQAAYQAVQADRMMDAADAPNAKAAQKEAASAQIQISVGSSKSVSETKRSQETAFGSSIMAGGNVSIVALGEKGVAGSGNLSIIGSDVTGKNVLLAATNDLHLLSQAQTSTEASTNKNSGWKVGIGIGVSDSGSGGGINIFASGYAGKGNANGNGTTYQESQISARDNLTLISGRDTVLMGAQARADSIRADIGRNLTIASQQDTDRYNAKQSQVNAGGSFSFGSMTGSAYIGASIGKTKSNYDSVIEQSGLYAGSGGFDIYVGKHTQLDGAVIASDAEAAKNKLSTETFGFTNLENKATYKSTTAGVNLGMSGAFDIAKMGGANGIGPSGLTFGQTSGSDSGTTYAAVAPGSIEVRSDKETGRDSTAGLSRDTAGANGSIGQIFDKDKVREQLEFQQAFGQLGMQIAGDVLKDLKKDDPDLWGEGKPGAIALHVAVAGIGAALGGGNVAGAMAGTVAGDVATSLMREQVELAVAGLSGEVRDQVTKVVLNVIASSAGGAIGGVSGAGGAAVADMYNRQLHPDERELAKKIAAEIRARGGDVSVEYIEDQMRQMSMVRDGKERPGIPDVQIGGVVQTDSGATWFNEPGSAVYVQNTSKPDYGLQGLILEITNNSSVPNLIHYLPTPVQESSQRFGYIPVDSSFRKICVTAECAAGLAPNITQLGNIYRANRAADSAAFISTIAGDVAAWSTMIGNPAAASAATAVGGISSIFEQLVRPNWRKAAGDSIIDMSASMASDRFPALSPVFNELGKFAKDSGVQTNLLGGSR